MNKLTRFISIIFLSKLITTVSLHAGKIHDAVVAEDLNKVKALLEADTTLIESKETGMDFTPFLCACEAGQVAIANFLFDKGADINAKDYYLVII